MNPLDYHLATLNSSSHDRPIRRNFSRHTAAKEASPWMFRLGMCSVLVMVVTIILYLIRYA